MKSFTIIVFCWLLFIVLAIFLFFKKIIVDTITIIAFVMQIPFLLSTVDKREIDLE